MSQFTRREFTKLSLTALSGAGLLSAISGLDAAESKKPNSRVKGVQIGLNVPYSFGNNMITGEETLKNCVELGVSGVELRTQPVEQFMGVPVNLISSKKGGGTPSASDLRNWRKSAPMEKVKEFRKMYETAGVLIEIMKVDNIFKMSDEELDYSFAMAKTLGARAISTEIPKNEDPKKNDDLKRLGSFADKHQLMVGYHGHTKTGPKDWENAFSLAKYNGANVDLGHFVAGNNTSPVPFLKEHHDRITHVHVKDKKLNEGANTVFGEGDTPIVEVLHLIRDNKWKMQATIEFEYKVPAGSDRMTEIAKTVKYCRDALAS